MKDTSFHGENLRRRARYIAVFSGLVIAFAVTVVLNINTGNVHIPFLRSSGFFFCVTGRQRNTVLSGESAFRES